MGFEGVTYCVAVYETRTPAFAEVRLQAKFCLEAAKFWRLRWRLQPVAAVGWQRKKHVEAAWDNRQHMGQRVKSCWALRNPFLI